MECCLFMPFAFVMGKEIKKGGESRRLRGISLTSKESRPKQKSSMVFFRNGSKYLGISQMRNWLWHFGQSIFKYIYTFYTSPSREPSTGVLFGYFFNDVGDSVCCAVWVHVYPHNNTVICGRATAAAEVDHLRNRIVSCHYGLPAMVATPYG
jgi:hypothetical protein